MSFRDNLWNLGDKSFRILSPYDVKWVIVLEGRYWGIWRLTPKMTKWEPLLKNPWTVAWSLRFNGGKTSWERKEVYRHLRENKAAQMFTGYVRKWTKAQGYKQKKQFIFSWAEAVVGKDALRPLLTWHKSDLSHLGNLVIANGISYRHRLAQNLAKHQPATLVTLLRKQHPRATRRSIKMLLGRSKYRAALFSATPSLTPEDLKQRDVRFAKGYGHDRHKKWLAVRRLYPRRPHLVREVLFLEQHVTEHIAVCANYGVVVPQEIHFDLGRLPNSAAVRRMEERIRNHKRITINPLAEARRAHYRGIYRGRNAYQAEWYLAENTKKQQKLKAHHRDLPLLKGFMNEPEGVELLVTSEEFQTEGNNMKHCVGMYKDSTTSLFYKIDRPEGRATVEIVPTKHGGAIRQLYGKYNQPVKPALRTVITEWAVEQFTL